MKLGILTFHSQLNYGGVLQCWALQTALEKMGHEVVVIDRWLTPDNWYLERGYDRKGKKWRLRFWLRSLLGLGDMRFWLRVQRTKSFIHNQLHLSPYHFCNWKDAPRDLGVDMIVVGSDQVWHCGDFGDPRPYLLEGAPDVPAIAYAASFGFPRIPPTLGNWAKSKADLPAEPVYRCGLSRFRTIGCRERTGVEICNGLGFPAEQVADPTLLLDQEDWLRFANCRADANGNRPVRRIACYLLGEPLLRFLAILEAFSENTGIRVSVLVSDWDRSVDILPIPKSPSSFRRWAVGLTRGLRGVRLLSSAGPREFVRTIAQADAVVTDSFHALVFATQFRKSVRFLAPSTDKRKAMFGRIATFSANARGDLVATGLDQTLSDIAAGKRILIDPGFLDAIRSNSFRFLHEALR